MSKDVAIDLIKKDDLNLKSWYVSSNLLFIQIFLTFYLKQLVPMIVTIVI